MRKVKKFIIRLEQERVLFRNEFRLLGPNKIKDFVVQFEIVEGEKHLTPVRYDIKHDYFHRDIIDMHGNNVDKKKIAVPSLEEAAKLSVDDLIHNWKSLLKVGGYSKLVSTLKSFPENNMQKAKGYLIDLVQHPGKIDRVPNVVDLTVKPETLTLKNQVIPKLVKGTSETKD